MRLEKVENSVHRNLNPTASSLGGPGFSIVELVNEPVAGYWNRDSCSGEIRLVHFKTSSAEFNFSGRSEVISPGTVRFLDLSSGGGFNAHAGLGTVQINIDRSPAWPGRKVGETTTENGRYQGEPAGSGIAFFPGCRTGSGRVSSGRCTGSSR
jgi:hypothetical protein